MSSENENADVNANADEREHWGVPFHQHAQIEIVEASPEGGRARIPAVPELCNHMGNVHGAMVFAVGEVTAAACMMGLLQDHLATLHGITRRAEIAYLKPARGAISGTARAGMSMVQILAGLERARSVDVPIDVALTDAEGVTVATLDVTWYVGHRRK